MAQSGSGLATVEEVRRELSGKPLLGTSKGRAWKDIAVDEFGSYTASDMVVGPRDHHILSINLTDTAHVRQQRCGRLFESPGRTGEASIIPSGFGSRWDGVLPAHVSLRFSPAVLTEVTFEARRGRYPQAEINNGFRLRDPFIAHISAIFSLELARAPHPAQEVLIDSLTTALLMHLLRSYTTATGVEERPAMDVGPASLRRALAYIEDQPNIRISLNELAGAAGVSRYHFSRLFKRHIGMSPAQYVECSRIARAKAMIRLGQLSLADVAQAVGFADQSHFTRRFRHHEGCTPAAYARDHARRLPPRH